MSRIPRNRTLRSRTPTFKEMEFSDIIARFVDEEDGMAASIGQTHVFTTTTIGRKEWLYHLKSSFEGPGPGRMIVDSAALLLSILKEFPELSDTQGEEPPTKKAKTEGVGEKTTPE